MRNTAPNTKSRFWELEVLRVTGISILSPTVSGSAFNSSCHGHIWNFSANFPSLPQSRNHALPPMFRKLKYLFFSGWKNVPNSAPSGASIRSHASPPSADSIYILFVTLCEYGPPVPFSGCA